MQLLRWLIPLVLVSIFFSGPAKLQAVTIFSPLVEIEIAPGESNRGIVKIFNETDQEIILTASVEAFAAGDELGRPVYLPAEQAYEYLNWFELVDEIIVVQPRQVIIVPFTVTVPATAAPGGYYAAIFWQQAATQSGGQAPVGIASKVGTLVFLTVTGEVVEAGALTEFTLEPPQGLFFSFPITFGTRFENTGTVHLRPSGAVTLTNWWGQRIALPLNPEQRAVLPHSARQFDVVWGQSNAGNLVNQYVASLKQEINLLAGGRYAATASFVYGQSASQTVEQTVTFWFVPVRLLITTLMAFLLLIVLVRINKKINRLKSGGKEKR